MARLLAPYRGRVFLTALAMLAATAAALAPPPLAKLAIDDGILARDPGTLYRVVAAFVVAATVYLVATAAQTYLVGWVGQRVLQDLRLRIFAHLQSLSMDFYTRHRAGTVISRLTNDVQALDQLVTDGVVTLVNATLMLAGTAVILVVLDAELALIAFLALPFLAAGSFAFRLVSAGAYRRTREKIAAINAELQESLAGIRVVRLFAREPRHAERLAGLNEANRAANMTTVKLSATYFPAVELLSAIVQGAMLAYGGLQVIDGQVTVGVLVAFIAALQNFFDPIQQLAQLYTTYQAGMAALDKISELLDTEPEIIDAPGAVDLPPLRGEVALEHVGFAYPEAEDRPALSDVNLTIAAGETVALVGATGAGKSTLAKLIARFHDPTAGVVRVDGHDLRAVTQHSLRAQLGIVPQESFLFSGTIGENVAFGKRDATPDEVRAACRAVGADTFIEALPDGYDATVGERGVNLSAGQRQLLAFARALIADPRILILDEATANVDPRTEARIEAGTHLLVAGRTALIIAHRFSTIRRADRIVMLAAGRVVEAGTHAELLAASGPFWRMAGGQ